MLSYAIAKGDARTLDMLLLAGAKIDAQDDSGDTPLMVAAQLESDVKVRQRSRGLHTRGRVYTKWCTALRSVQDSAQ